MTFREWSLTSHVRVGMLALRKEVNAELVVEQTVHVGDVGRLFTILRAQESVQRHGFVPNSRFAKADAACNLAIGHTLGH